MNADLILLLARVLFSALFIMSGIGHFAQREAMTGYAKFKGVPAAGAGVVLSGIVFLLGGLSILLGVHAEYGALAIAIALLPTAVLMHAFWKETDPQAKQMEMIGFNKDLSLAGAAFALFVLFHEFGGQLGLLLVK